MASILGSSGRATAAVVANMEYIFSGTEASGTLNGEAFASTFHMVLFANTSDLTAPNPYAPMIPASSASIVIDGVGTYDIITPLLVFSTYNFSGFATHQWDLFLFYPNPGGIWDLTAPLSENTSTAALVQWGYDGGVNTSGGMLFFSTASIAGATYQSIPVPESSALALSPLALIGLARRRRL